MVELKMNDEIAIQWLENGDYNDDTIPTDNVDQLIAQLIREKSTRIAALEATINNQNALIENLFQFIGKLINYMSTK